MSINDLSYAIKPKSDQLNADDLIAGAIQITVTGVRAITGDQPLAISFQGDNNKPYKPCLSMRRVLIMAWGKDGNSWIGKSMVLFLDPNVRWAGQAVGGIRISHLSHIQQPMTLSLTATRGKRTPYQVQVLQLQQPQQEGF
jgi:hypothetical protein